MKYIIVVLSLMIFISGCAFFPILVGSGNLVEGQSDLKDFQQVSVDGGFEITVVQDNEYGIIITVDDNILEHVQIEKEGDELQVKLDPFYNYQDVTLKALVTMPDLDSIDLSGASNMVVVDADQFPYAPLLEISLSGASTLLLPTISAGTVRLDLSGASSAAIGFQVGDVHADLSGASTLQANGLADDLVADISGASQLDMKACTVNDADADLSGASWAWVTMDGVLNADLSGASTLYYRGTVVLGNLDISGGSKLRTY